MDLKIIVLLLALAIVILAVLIERYRREVVAAKKALRWVVVTNVATGCVGVAMLIAQLYYARQNRRGPTVIVQCPRRGRPRVLRPDESLEQAEGVPNAVS